MPPGTRALPALDAALAGFLARVAPLGRAERVPLLASAGRVLVAAVHATAPVPAFDTSAMDGFAIAAPDASGATPGSPRALRVAGAVAIGTVPAIPVVSGTAIAVATGSAIPQGASAVVKHEDTGRDGDGRVLIRHPVAPGENVIPAGSDLAAGQQLLAPGYAIRPGDAGILASIGCKEVTVASKPRVAVIATGSELVDLDVLPAGEDGRVDPGLAGRCKVIDSNRHAVASLVTAAGGIVARSLIVDDDEARIRQLVDEALDTCDMLVTTGGTSAGERDYVPAIVATSHELLVHGIAMTPGRATILGVGKGKPIVGLSGVPVAVEAGMRCIGLPVLWRLAGAAVLDPRPVVAAKLAVAAGEARSGSTRLMRVVLRHDAGDADALPLAVPLEAGGRGMQRSMAASDGFVAIPPGSGGLSAGDVVHVRLHWP